MITLLTDSDLGEIKLTLSVQKKENRKFIHHGDFEVIKVVASVPEGRTIEVNRIPLQFTYALTGSDQSDLTNQKNWLFDNIAIWRKDFKEHTDSQRKKIRQAIEKAIIKLFKEDPLLIAHIIKNDKECQIIDVQNTIIDLEKELEKQQQLLDQKKKELENYV